MSLLASSLPTAHDAVTPWPPGDLVMEWDVTALYEAARLEQQIGKADEARGHYREFLEYWGDADMDVPMVEQAREQLAELGGS